MPSVNNERTFTFTLEGEDEINIDSEDGIIACAVNNVSDVAGTVEGDPDFIVDGKTTEPISVVRGTPVTISAATPSGRLDKITISAPAGCTLQVMMQR